jgi:chemotaxis protein CheD
MQEQIYDIGMGEYQVAGAPVVLKSSGVGSCLVLCIYDRDKKIGGMVHAMLPSSPDMVEKIEYNARFVDDSIRVIVS